MVLVLIMAFSTLLQFVAACLSVRMIRITGKRSAWILIAVAISLAALRRGSDLFRFVFMGTGVPPHLISESFSLLTSVCMIAGIALIAPLFISIKCSEESMRESATKFRIVAENTYDWEYWLSPEGRFIYISPACKRISGYDTAEFMADPDLRLRIIHPDDSENYEDHRRYAREKKGSGEIEFRIIHADGTVRWIGHVCQTVFDSRGNYLGLRGSNRDITKRKNAEEIILKEKLFSETVINSLPGSFYLFDEHGKFIQWNRNLELITGYSAEEIEKMNPLDFFDMEARNLVAGKIQEVLINGKADVEAALLQKNGAKVPFYFNGQLFLLSGKRCVIGMGIDITERRKAEEARRRAEEASRKLFEDMIDLYNNAPCGYHSLNKDGLYVLVNDTELAWLGYSRNEIIRNKKFSDVLTSSSVKTFNETFPVLKNRGSVLDIEVDMVRKDGTILPVLLSATATRDADGNFVMSRSTIYDITKRRQVDEERKNLEEQLHQAHRMDAIGQLAGGVAHDFNNLLTSIIGYSDLLLTQLPENHFAKDKLTIIRDAGDKAADLVRQLLAFSRKQMLEMRPVNINEIVWNMSKIFARTIGEDIELELNIMKPVKNILADAGQIEQILMNLVVNARDAMPEGGRLTIETDDVYLDETYALMHSQLVKSGHYVMLLVADNGMGMSREVQDKIFEPFYTTKEAGKGTGLGLSTTHGIVRQHNGYIWVYSEPGQGTTFRVYFPTIEEKAKEIKKDEASINVKGTETILVVDDEPLVRQFASDVLQPLGYRVMEASGADEALKIADGVGGKVDLLLTDLVMPGTKGNELGKLFIEKWPAIKVVLMSGYGDKADFHEGLGKNGIIFMQKPLTPVKLASKLRQVLDESK